MPELVDVLSPLEETLIPLFPVWASTDVGVCGSWVGSMGDKLLGLRVGEYPVYNKKLQGLCPFVCHLRLAMTCFQGAFLLGHAGPQTSLSLSVPTRPHTDPDTIFFSSAVSKPAPSCLSTFLTEAGH